MTDWELIVGNVGSIYKGTNGFKAHGLYSSYVADSKTGLGRTGGEDVTLFKDGEPTKEYYGKKGEN